MKSPSPVYKYENCKYSNPTFYPALPLRLIEEKLFFLFAILSHILYFSNIIKYKLIKGEKFEI